MNNRIWSIVLIFVSLSLILAGHPVAFGLGITAGYFGLKMAGLIGKNGSRNLVDASQKALGAGQKSKVVIDDKFVLRLIERLGGRITVDELDRQTSLSAEEGKAILDKMTEQGILEIDLEEVQRSGKIIYRQI